MARWTKACGKRRFATESVANAELDKIWRHIVRGTANRSQTFPCRTYACKQCKGYHHTSKPLRRQEGA